jgi:effector-binding domain-containing protein
VVLRVTLTIEHRFTASYDSVKRFVRSLEHKTEIPFTLYAATHSLKVTRNRYSFLKTL